MTVCTRLLCRGMAGLLQVFQNINKFFTARAFLARYYQYPGQIEIDFMKQLLQRLVTREDNKEKFHLSSALFMILVFLAFWGVSFYVLVNSLG
jgi:hypothetical protein